ncbi:hypothetical protein HFN63_36525 [Rhizobium leguminosarum]|uniref:hypothetical protein n=1 Tax=Rhizobium leguminosarum TaxID=384 RepID=UPI001C95DF00|nr:hypothetical protein [Rhizobium leguminosarum]MBY5775432.1 hypothetical protein [Rhizobium leguminosarum]
MEEDQPRPSKIRRLGGVNSMGGRPTYVAVDNPADLKLPPLGNASLPPPKLSALEPAPLASNNLGIQNNVTMAPSIAPRPRDAAINNLATNIHRPPPRTPLDRNASLSRPEELSHAEYVRRAGGAEGCLSVEHWKLAVERLQIGYSVKDVAGHLDVEEPQITEVHFQLMEMDLENAAAEPLRRPFSARSAPSGRSEAGVATRGATAVSAEELKEVRRLQMKYNVPRNPSGELNAFGRAIGKDDEKRRKYSILNSVGKALAKEMIRGGAMNEMIMKTFETSRGAVRTLVHEAYEAEVAAYAVNKIPLQTLGGSSQRVGRSRTTTLRELKPRPQDRDRAR